MTGTLGLFSLVDLFQLLAASSRSGRLTVDHPEGSARVYFEEGLAVHAEFAGRSGEDAVYALFSDEQGSFEFMLGVPAPQTTIESRTENLVLEATRRLDESRRGDATPVANETGPFGGSLSREAAVPPTPSPSRRPEKRGQSEEAKARAEEPATVEAPGPEIADNQASNVVDVGSDEPEVLHDPASEQNRGPQPPMEPVQPQPQAPAQSPVTTTGSGSGVTLTAIPSFAEKAKTVADMSLSKEDVELLRAVDGKRNVGQIAQEAGLAGEATRATVQRFVDLGVLRLSNRKPRTARLVTHLTKARLPHGIVGVDPSIMSAWEKSLGYPAQSIACRREDGRVCLLGAMALDDAGPFLMINRETLMHADLAVNQPLLVKPVPQNET